MNVKQDEIDLREIFYLLKKRLVIILIVAAVFGIGGGLYSRYMIQPLYSSSSKIYVINKSTSVVSMADLSLSTGLTADYLQLIKSRTVLEPVIENLNLNMSYKALNGLVSVTNPKDTHILDIQVIYSDPEMAKKIADEVVSVSKQCIKDIMATNEVNVVEEATVNVQKVSPNNKKNALMGALVGAFLICGFFIVRYLLDNTVKTADDVERYLGLNTLAIIPYDKKIVKANKNTYSKNVAIRQG